MTSFIAHFDGRVFRPLTTPAIQSDTDVRIHVELLEPRNDSINIQADTLFNIQGYDTEP